MSKTLLTEKEHEWTQRFEMMNYEMSRDFEGSFHVCKRCGLRAFREMETGLLCSYESDAELTCDELIIKEVLE